MRPSLSPSIALIREGGGEEGTRASEHGMLAFGINNRNWGGQLMLKEYLFMTESHSPGLP